VGFVFYQDGFRTYFPFWGGSQAATRSNRSYELKTFYLNDPGVFKCPAASGAGRTYYQTNGKGDIQNYPDNPFIINAHKYIAYGYNGYYIGSGEKYESAHWQVYPGDTVNSIDDYRSAPRVCISLQASSTWILRAAVSTQTLSASCTFSRKLW